MAALGTWGERWIELAPEHLDPGLVLHAWAGRFLAHERLPKRRVVVQFDFWGLPKKKARSWIIFHGERSEVCATPPGLRGRSVRRGGSQGPDRMAPGSDQMGGRPPSRSDPRAWTVQARPGAADVEPPQSRRPHEGRPATASGCGDSALKSAIPRRDFVHIGFPCPSGSANDPVEPSCQLREAPGPVTSTRETTGMIA